MVQLISLRDKNQQNNLWFLGTEDDWSNCFFTNPIKENMEEFARKYNSTIDFHDVTEDQLDAFLEDYQ